MTALVVDNLGGAWTPTALQSRADTLAICNLAAPCKRKEACFDLIASVGLSPFHDAYGPLINLTLSPDPSP